MVSEMQSAMKNNKLKILMTGFGVGLSWGSVYIETENIHIPDMIIEQ